MKTSKKIIEEKGVKSRLRLGEKTSKGVVSTGRHRVRLVSDEKIEKVDYMGKRKEYIRYTLNEGGELKYYDVPLLDAKGEVHYLIQRFAEFSEGQEVFIEMTSKNMKNFVQITPIAGEVIESDYEEAEEDEEVHEEHADGEGDGDFF